MGVFIGSYDAKTLAVGSYNAKTAYVGSYLVFGDDAVYTYKLTDVGVRYSTSDWINPSLNNYAYLRGTFITYKNGREEKREGVDLIIDSVSSDYLVNNGYSVTWNYDKYKAKQTSWSSVTIRGNYAGYTAEGTVSVAGNYNNVLAGAEIYDFKLGDHTSPYTIGNSSQTLGMYVRLGRIYNWTSGEYSHTNEYEAYNVPTNLVGYIQQSQTTQGSRCLYYFKNNSSVEIKFTAWLEDTYSWWDPVDLMPDSNTDYDYQDVVLAPGASITVDLAADGGEGIPYSGSHGSREYFTIGGKEFYLTTSSQTFTGNYPVNNWVDFDEAVSWLSITDMTVSINQNTGGSRGGTITVKDKVFPSVTKSFTLLQEAVGYIFTGNTAYSVAAVDTGCVIRVTSKTDNGGYINLSTSNVSVTGGATVASVINSQGIAQIAISFGANTSTSYERKFAVTLTQPNSGKQLVVNITQGKASPTPTYTYVFEPYGTQMTNISTLGRRTSTTIKIQSTRNGAAWPITASNVSGLGIGTVTVNSGTTATGYYEVVVKHGANNSDFVRLLDVTMTQPDSGKQLVFNIEQAASGIRPIDPDLPVINPDLPSIDIGD